MSVSFESAWQRAEAIPGWLKRGQARLLWDAAQDLDNSATVVEIGSHQGRSTVVLGEALSPTHGQLIAIDPFVEGRLFGGLSTRDHFERNIAVAELGDVVDLVQDYSTSLRPTWSRSIDMLYIDGKHDYWTVSDDLRWSDFLRSGAVMIIHDSFSSIGVTLALLRHVLFSNRLAFERRSDSQAQFRVGRPTVRDRLRIIAQLPWWIRNVFLKVLLRLRLRSVARWFGHDSPYDPF